MKLFSKKRRGLYVFFKHVKDINKLENYGNLISYSKKYRYLYFYVDEEKVDEIIKILEEKKIVRKVVKSELVDLGLDFSLIE
ncbi:MULTISPECIES: DUF2129 domain-containing protein [unclassified Gemella]|uniref:DUF2129 domain-containing protein n=1 Tax=unclassified Gemella TaxID=2624949 RepID=UPI0015D09B90|nr:MULTISPECIES: DUF2129 domain-containing protein [unclassified Gemella]MBF0710278.1 DUF2129 domain-containing protein [Gemella sp. GL1.1]NYS27622.1 DUF2129 domain-containing protein [Gemella sp. GL1]